MVYSFMVLNYRDKIIYFLFLFPFLVFSFFYFDNAGGQGFFVSINVFFIIALSFLLLKLTAFSLITKLYLVRVSYLTISLSLFLFVLVVFSVFSEGYERKVSIFVCLFLGLTLLFSLVFDLYELDTNACFRYLTKVTLIAGFFMAIIGILQVSGISLSHYYIDLDYLRPVGVVQQVNVHAVLMVFYLHLLLIYSIFNHSDKLFSAAYYLILLLLVCAFSFNVGVSGSRVALLSYIIGLVFLFLLFKNLIKASLKTVFSCVLVSIIFVAFGIFYSGVLDLIAAKASSMNSGSDIRIHLYKISYELVSNMDLFGYGLSSFQRVFQDAAAYYQLNTSLDSVIGDVKYTHPHNELFYWLIQIGYLGFLPFFLFLYLLYLSYVSSKNNFKVAIYLLIPFSLHMMLELPFYLSHYVWFLLILVLIFATKDMKKVEVKLSNSFASFFNLICFLFSAIAFLFSIHSAFSLKGISEKIVGNDSKYINYALNNYYFSDVTYHLVQRDYIFLSDLNVYDIENFITFAENRLLYTPDILLFSDLIQAYYRLDKHDSAERVYKRALYLYPNQQLIKRKWQQLYDINERLEEESVEEIGKSGS